MTVGALLQILCGPIVYNVIHLQLQLTINDFELTSQIN